MKLALISPQRTRLEIDQVRTGTPLGLLSLAALTRREMPDVEINFIDAMAEGSTEEEVSPGVFRYGLTKDELKRRLEKINPDIVGVSNIFTSEWQNAALCSKIAKACGSTVILGGHHPTYEAEFMLRNTGADYVVLGEGEYTLLKLLTTLKKRENPTDVEGIAYLIDSLFVQTNSSKLADNLDDLPDPAFDLLNPRLYKPEFSHSGKIPNGRRSIIDYSLSRGCPIACTFCTSTSLWGKKIRAYSPKRVRSQIKTLRNIGFDYLSLEDDQVLMIQSDSLDALMEELGTQDFKWDIDAGVYHPLVSVKEKFFKKAAENGCHRVFLPIEHPAIEFMHEKSKYKSVKTQDEVKESVGQACDVFTRQGIEFYVAIMVGFKEETYDSLRLVEDYAKFVKERGAAWVNFFYPKPLPGTPDYKDYPLVDPKRRWQIAPQYWTIPIPVLKPAALSIEELTNTVNEISQAVNGYNNIIVGASHSKEGSDLKSAKVS